MQILINIDEKEYKRIIKGNWIGNPIAEIIEAGTVLPPEIPSAEYIYAMQYQRGYIDGFKDGKALTESFKGMTNGEVMDKVFPEISECLYDEVLSEYWWNYPYKTQKRSEK